MPRKSTKKSARSSSKKKVLASGADAFAASQIDNPLRTGMPALDSIMEILLLLPSPAGATEATPLAGISKYRIIRTNEVDAYEDMPSSFEERNAFLKSAAAAPPTGDSYKGTSRKAAKTSIANATIKNFADLKDLIVSLPSEQTMKALKPPIKDTATSDRVALERRNIRVRAFIYAASREKDNDYHLIIGRDPDAHPEMYMTMELSGLPPQSHPSYQKLKAARDAYKAFFVNHPEGLPGKSYDFYDPPIPVEIQGSLLWDATHVTGSRPGPQSLKSRMPTIWEVHPISKIILEP
jgi:hypothetical protein